MNSDDLKNMNNDLTRIARALEVMAGTPPRDASDWDSANKQIWDPSYKMFRPVTNAIKPPPSSLLVGVEDQIKTLYDNTLQFAKGFTANNALLWGARGMGKSATVKTVHHRISANPETPLILLELSRSDLADMPYILDRLSECEDRRFILFCDDLSFEPDDSTYKSLKAVLDGGIGGRPPHVLFYATSNRRHLMPKDHQHGSKQDVMRVQENNQEQISISDRFGLWIGFHGCTQDQYLDMIDRYIDAYDLPVNQKDAHDQALLWSKTRGSRSGRVAWQFIQDLAGRLNIPIY